MPTEVTIVEEPEVRAIEVHNEDGSIVLKVWRQDEYVEQTIKEAD